MAVPCPSHPDARCSTHDHPTDSSLQRNDGLFGVIKRYLKRVVAYNHAQVATAVDDSCKHNRAVHGSLVKFYKFKTFLEQYFRKGAFESISQVREMEFRLGNPGLVRFRIDSTHDATWYEHDIRPENTSPQELVDAIQNPSTPLDPFKVPFEDFTLSKKRREYIEQKLKPYYVGEVGSAGEPMQDQGVAGYPTTQLVDVSLFYDALFRPAHEYVDPIKHVIHDPPPPPELDDD